MSICINNTCSGKFYGTPIKSQDEKENKDTKKLQKNKQITSVKEGEYYCTYMVDEEGKRVLINKVPIGEVERENELKNKSESKKLKSCNYNESKDSVKAFECKKQLEAEGQHRKNVQDMMDILRGNPRKLGK